MKTICLSDEYLIDYIEGRLTSNQRRQVEFHLSLCDQCLEYSYIFRGIGSAVFIGDASIAPSALTKRVIGNLDRLDQGSLLDRLVARARALCLQWQHFLELNGKLGFATLAPIRGNKALVADDLVLLNKTFSDLETEISVEKIDRRLANVSVAVRKANPEKAPVRVSLMTGDREIASYLVDTGEAYFESVAFGHYTLVFTHNGSSIGRYSFNIKETGNVSRQKGR
jgi:hypothetical protein